MHREHNLFFLHNLGRWPSWHQDDRHLPVFREDAPFPRHQIEVIEPLVAVCACEFQTHFHMLFQQSSSGSRAGVCSRRNDQSDHHGRADLHPTEAHVYSDGPQGVRLLNLHFISHTSTNKLVWH